MTQEQIDQIALDLYSARTESDHELEWPPYRAGARDVAQYLQGYYEARLEQAANKNKEIASK